MAKNFANRLAIENRRSEVASLYLCRYSMRQIAKALNVDVSTISRDISEIRRKWHEESVMDVKERVALETARLDNLEAEAWRSWQTEKDPRFLAEVNKVITQRCKIFGLGNELAQALAQGDLPEIKVRIREVSADKPE